MSHPPVRPPGQEGPDVSYVVSHYPAVSHTFILREVRALRDLGVSVQTFSVHRAPAEDVLSAAAIEESERTVNLRPVGPLALLRVHLGLLLGHPIAYVRSVVHAVGVSPRRRHGRLWQLFYFAEAGLLYHECRRRNGRRLHAHLANVAADVCWLAVDLGRRIEPGAGWTWSFTMHGPTELFAVDQFNLRRKVEAADLVICISEFCRSQLMQLVGENQWYKLQVAHCGVDTEVFGPVDRRSRDHGDVVVLCLGRMTPEKGQVLLLEAFAQLAARGRPVRLVLAGDGPSRRSLEARANELGISAQVEFLGAIGEDELPELFARADIFCLPSFAEGLPIVLMEAMARNLPVVTTPVAAITELVHDGVNGLLVLPGRVDVLAGALRRLADDEGLRIRLGQEGREAVEAGFRLAECARQVGELLGVVDGSEVVRAFD